VFILFVNYFQTVSSPQAVPLVPPTLRVRAPNMDVAGPHLCVPPAMRGNMPPPPHYQLQIRVNRPPPRPPYDCAEQRFRPPTPVPVFRPPTPVPVFRPRPPPEQCRQPNDPSLSNSALPFPLRPPPVVLLFEPRFGPPYADNTGAHVFPQMEYHQPVVSSVRQSFLPPQYPGPQSLPSLNSLTVTSQFSAPVVASVGYEVSPSEPVFNQPAALIQAAASSAVSEPVELQSQSVLPIFSRNVDSMPQKSSDKSNSSSSSAYDERARQSRSRERRASETSPGHSRKSPRSRDSRGDRSFQRDTHRGYGRQRHSRFENRYKINVPC